MANELKLRRGRYEFYCSGKPDQYGHGIYGVWIFKDGKLIIHQSWNKMPNRSEAERMIDFFAKGEKNEIKG